MTDSKKLSSMDASFLYLETPEMPMHVGSMAIFRLPENYNGNFFEDFKAMIGSRLHLAPILKARLKKAPLDIDHPSWVEDDQFDIDRHIFRGSLPAPYDRATLERIVGWMHAKLLNRARPLWEFYVFEGSAAPKSIDLPRSGKSDIGSILFDNAMFQIESAVKFVGSLPTMAKSISDVLGKVTDPKSRDSIASMVSPSTILN